MSICCCLPPRFLHFHVFFHNKMRRRPYVSGAVKAASAAPAAARSSVSGAAPRQPTASHPPKRNTASALFRGNPKSGRLWYAARRIPPKSESGYFLRSKRATGQTARRPFNGQGRGACFLYTPIRAPQCGIPRNTPADGKRARGSQSATSSRNAGNRSRRRTYRNCRGRRRRTSAGSRRSSRG